MAKYRAIVVMETEEDVTLDLISEYLTDVLASMPFDGSDPPKVVKVVMD